MIPASTVVLLSPKFCQRRVLLFYVESEPRGTSPVHNVESLVFTPWEYAICPDRDLNHEPSDWRTCVLTMSPSASLFFLRGHVRMFLWRKADVVFALCAVLLMWVFQFRVLWMWIPLGIWLCRLFGGCGCVWCRWIWWMMLRLLVMCMAWHLCGWKWASLTPTVEVHLGGH